MSEGRSEDFQKHFCGTHFFNPARYLKLFEIIPTEKTSQEVIDFLNEYGEKFLGKTSVIAKDTPAFIGNRIGIFGIMSVFRLDKELGLTVEEVDKLTRAGIGGPKSAAFGAVEVVGLDALVHVAEGLYENCPDDEAHGPVQLPDFVKRMKENECLGSKGKQRVYKQVDKQIVALDLNTLEYN